MIYPTNPAVALFVELDFLELNFSSPCFFCPQCIIQIDRIAADLCNKSRFTDHNHNHVQNDWVFTCGGLARRSISAPCFLLLLLQRMDFFVSSANISFSGRLAHPTQPAHTAQPAHPTIYIWISDFTDIWISRISVTY